MIKFLLDEHVTPALRDAITAMADDIVVVCIGEAKAPARGTRDPDLLRWCEREGFVLITNNRKTMPQHFADHLTAGRTCPGIVLLTDRLTLAEVAADLVLLALVVEPAALRDTIRHLPLLT